ncbi:uncharacterized protein LOC144713629 [Wolffia australiana]
MAGSEWKIAMADRSNERRSDGVSESADVSNLMLESASAAWTDEKHYSFLNSMEASFVSQMYREDLLRDWASRKHYENFHHNSSSSQEAITEEASSFPRKSWIRRQRTSSNILHCSSPGSCYVDSATHEVSDQNFVDNQPITKKSDKFYAKVRSRKRDPASGNKEARTGRINASNSG